MLESSSEKGAVGEERARLDTHTHTRPLHLKCVCVHCKRFSVLLDGLVGGRWELLHEPAQAFKTCIVGQLTDCLLSSRPPSPRCVCAAAGLRLSAVPEGPAHQAGVPDPLLPGGVPGCRPGLPHRHLSHLHRCGRAQRQQRFGFPQSLMVRFSGGWGWVAVVGGGSN